MKKKPARLYLHRTRRGEAPAIARRYDDTFRVSDDYRATLPDMMDAVDAIEGADVPIQQVGVAGFKLPLRFAVRRGAPRELEATVTGTVSLEAGLKGINMSRIMRSFYAHQARTFTPATLERILGEYRRRVGAHEARLRVAFSYPLLQRSLRSGLEGWQYLRAAFEGTMDRAGRFRQYVQVDFVYSSACPCSAELAEHARDTRGVYSIPHSQRSKARVLVEVARGRRLAIEDLHAHCLAALRTETQVLVRREDEQAFAEMNGMHLKFVEDAARLLHARLAADPRIVDFQVACAHLESLHAHDAVSVLCKGVPGGLRADFMDFGSLVC